jgi:hypothetical protein
MTQLRSMRHCGIRTQVAIWWTERVRQFGVK